MSNSQFTRREALKSTASLIVPFIAPELHPRITAPQVSFGPIVDPKVKVAVSKEGVKAPGYKFRIPNRVPAPRTAKWIGASKEKDNLPVVLFRHECTLTAPSRQILAKVSGDVTYRIWINGVLAMRGPSDMGMDYNRTTTGKFFFDVRDFSHLFKAGKNVIAAEVFRIPVTGSEGSKKPGSFLFEISDGAKVIAATGTDWKASSSEHWSNQNGRWTYDGSKEPEGWHDLGFDDSGWESAITVQDVWQPLVMSEIPARMESLYPIKGVTRPAATVSYPPTQLFPMRFSAEGSAGILFDRVMPAYITIRVTGGDGETLHIEPNELDAPGHNRAAAFRLTGEEQVYELPFLDSFSVINLRAVGIKQPLTILEVRAVYCSQPVDYRGSFHSSDQQLNRLWEICRWVSQICLQTHHLDSPHHQEPICDPGDYMILSLNNYASFFQPALTRQDLRKYAWIMAQCKNQVFHTSYALLWLQMLMDYYDHSGELSLVKELAPSVHSLLDTFTGYIGANGIISEAPNYMFMDWVEIAGFPGHHPPAVIGQGYMTAFFYRALADGARIAQLTGDTKREQKYQNIRTKIYTAFQRQLWVEDRGLYRDGLAYQTHVKPGQWLPAEKQLETFTAHVNILAVLYDLAPKARQAEILERAITGPDFTCQPYFMHFAYEAMAHCGLFGKFGVDQMKRLQIIEQTQSVREMWNTGDLSHGWGASPLRQMSTKILGVQVKTPNQVTIAPIHCGLQFANGIVPTANGDIHVAWKRASGKMNLDCTIPAGVTAEILLPGLRKTVSGGKHKFTAAIAG